MLKAARNTTQGIKITNRDLGCHLAPCCTLQKTDANAAYKPSQTNQCLSTVFLDNSRSSTAAPFHLTLGRTLSIQNTTNQDPLKHEHFLRQQLQNSPSSCGILSSAYFVSAQQARSSSSGQATVLQLLHIQSPSQVQQETIGSREWNLQKLLQSTHHAARAFLLSFF